MGVGQLSESDAVDAIAVVPIGELLHVGIGSAGPRIADSIVVGEIFVVFYVRGDPKGDPSLVWPLDGWALNNGAVVYPVWWQRHEVTPLWLDVNIVAPMRPEPWPEPKPALEITHHAPS